MDTKIDLYQDTEKNLVVAKWVRSLEISAGIAMHSSAKMAK